MKIGFFTERYLPQTDGIVYSIESFRRELESLGHEVYIFAPAPSLRYKEKNKYIIRFPAIKGLWFEDYMTKFPWTPQAYKKAKSLHLDIIHTHTPSEMGLFGMSIALKEHIPLVSTYHTDLFEYIKHYPQVLPGAIILAQLVPLMAGRPDLFRTSFTMMKPETSVDKWSQKIVRRMIPLVNNLCDLVIAPSTKVEKQLTSWKTTKPITVLPTGVDKMATNLEEIEQFRQTYKIHPEDKVVLFVGRLASEKNIDLLIAAFGLVLQQLPSAKLLIIGDNPYRATLETQVKELGIKNQVIFSGYITDRIKLGAAYSVATVFAFPSLTDTQGLVIHEAANSGVPCVLIDRGITEVVVNNVSGLYAKNNAADFAEKLVKILSDAHLHDQLGKSAMRLSARLSARQQALKLEALYQDLVNKQAAKRLNP